MNMVAMADHSNQPIFPQYCSPTEWPWPLTYMVGEARRIISYHEHLSEEQRPPKMIWHSRRKCAAWIEDHKPGANGGDSSSLYFNESEVER